MLTRRRFLQEMGVAGAALVVGFRLDGRPAAGAEAVALNAFVRIAPDNTVTIVSKHIEFGQGTYSGLATILAEELDADWSQVRVEAGRVLRHPRCLNCHPEGDRPLQGTGDPHQPPVQRGPDGRGVTAMRCTTCHPAANFDPGHVPGHPDWHLAPASMAWQHRSLAQICAQLKDPARNGGHSLSEIVEHTAHDPLVGWAWQPGVGREPAPGTQASFGALIKAWADSGAACPTR